MTARVIKV